MSEQDVIATDSGMKISQTPNYLCETHGEIGELTLDFHFDGLNRHYCLKCLENVLSQHFKFVELATSEEMK